jgi:photosystem II stability/assembly factor-like uncharacterized protein
MSTPNETLQIFTPAPTYTSELEHTVEAATTTPSPKPTWQPSVPTEVASLAMPVLAEDMLFADDEHGWILGIRPMDLARTQWEFAMARSSDAGDSWDVAPMPVPVSLEQYLQSGIYFADEQRGWLFIYQSYPSFMSALYSTQDGGQSWQEESPRGSIVEIARAFSGEIWAMELYENSSDWRLLMVAGPGYETWHEPKLSIPQDMQPYDIVLQDQSHVWFSELVPHSTGEGSDAQVFDLDLLLTSDGGQSWERHATPCGGFLGGTEFNTSLVGVGESQLWLGCGQAAGAGSGTKFVYLSSDGGRTWEHRGSSADGSLPSGGGYFRELDAISDDFVYMNWRRSEAVILSRDGGQSWDYSSPACDSESTVATFFDQNSGWAYGNTWDRQHICLSRTSDGGRTWQCRILPEGEPCAQP